MAGGQFLGFGADVSNITTSAIQSVIGSFFAPELIIFNSVIVSFQALHPRIET